MVPKATTKVNAHKGANAANRTELILQKVVFSQLSVVVPLRS